jgi:hypothetical protein
LVDRLESTLASGAFGGAALQLQAAHHDRQCRVRTWIQ